jgi:hypothetical protein
MLTAGQALNIYEIKLSMQSGLLRNSGSRSISPTENRSLIRGKSVTVSKLFGMSSRAIRDIWNRRTWTHITECLWHREKVSRIPIAEQNHSHGPNSSSLKVRPILLSRDQNAVPEPEESVCKQREIQNASSEPPVPNLLCCASSSSAAVLECELPIAIADPMTWTDPFYADWGHW